MSTGTPLLAAAAQAQPLPEAVVPAGPAFASQAEPVAQAAQPAAQAGEEASAAAPAGANTSTLSESVTLDTWLHRMDEAAAAAANTSTPTPPVDNAANHTSAATKLLQLTDSSRLDVSSIGKYSNPAHRSGQVRSQA